MNILETFFYVFESDASKLDQGLKDSENATKRVQKELDEADRRAGLLGQTFLSAAKGAGAAVAAFFSYAALTNMVRTTVQNTDALAKQAQALGVNTQQLELMDAAAAAAGGQAGAFASSLATFNQRVQDVARRETPELVKLLDRVGVSLRDVKANLDDPIALLRDMADGLQDISQAEAVALGQKLGIDVGTINLLRQGRMGVEEAIAAQRELGHVTDEQLERTASYNDALDRQRRVWDDVRRRLVFTVLPVFERLANFLEGAGRLVRDNSGVVLWALGLIATALTATLVPSLVRASVALWSLIAPFALIGAGVLAVGAAVALIADDLYNFMQGNDSVIGRVAARWPIVGDAIRAVGNVLAWLIAMGVEFGAFFVRLFTDGPQAAIDSFRAAFQRIGDDIESIYPVLTGIGGAVAALGATIIAPFQALVLVVQGATSSITALLMDGPAAALSEIGRILQVTADRFPLLGRAAALVLGSMTASARTLLDLWGRIFGAIGRAVAALGSAGDFVRGAARAVLGGGSSPPPTAALAAGRAQLAPAAVGGVGAVSSAALAAGTTNNRTVTVDVGGVEVNTRATDADSIASDIGSALQRQMRSAVDQYDDGVAA